MKALGKGVTWPDLCFRTTSLAAVRTAGETRSLGDTEEACAVFQVGDLGLPVKGTDNMGRETSIK